MCAKATFCTPAWRHTSSCSLQLTGPRRSSLHLLSCCTVRTKSFEKTVAVTADRRDGIQDADSELDQRLQGARTRRPELRARFMAEPDGVASAGDSFALLLPGHIASTNRGAPQIRLNAVQVGIARSRSQNAANLAVRACASICELRAPGGTRKPHRGPRGALAGCRRHTTVRMPASGWQCATKYSSE